MGHGQSRKKGQIQESLYFNLWDVFWHFYRFPRVSCMDLDENIFRGLMSMSICNMEQRDTKETVGPLPLVFKDYLAPWNGVTRGSGWNLPPPIGTVLQEAVKSSVVVATTWHVISSLYTKIRDYHAKKDPKHANASMLTLAQSLF